MSNTHLNSLAVLVAVSMFLLVASGQNTKEQPVDVPKVPQLLGMMMFDSSLPDSREKNLAELSEVFPLQQTSNNGMYPDNALLYDQHDNGDDNLDDAETGPFINMYGDDQPPVFAKRGRYHHKNQGHTKRNSLSDLIRRLMALKGNSFTDGRITMMRFGTGRRK